MRQGIVALDRRGSPCSLSSAGAEGDPLDLLVEHAQTEETAMYPAAILVGQVVRQRLGIRAAALA